MIDWLQEEEAERERARQQNIRAIRGLRGLLTALLETSRMWFITVATGVGVGVIGAWLDVLIHW